MTNKQQFLITMAKELGVFHNGEIVSVPGVSKTFDTETLALKLNKLAGDFATNQIMAELAAEKRGIETMANSAARIMKSEPTNEPQ